MMEKLLNIRDKKILVIGDSMLDHYINVNPKKISSEYPGLIYDYKYDYYQLGGASNVANNIAKYNVEVDLLTIVGNDNNSKIFFDKLSKENINDNYVIVDPTYKTIIKERYYSDDYKQIIRVDYEDNNISNSNKIIEYLNKAFERKYDLVLISDYRKGLITNDIFNKIIELSNKRQIKVLCDPKDSQIDYHDLYVLKPNRNEMKNIVGTLNDSDIIKYKKENNIDNIVLTLGDEGIKFYDENNNIGLIPAVKNEVFDVTGAGDTVISFLSLGILSQFNFIDICKLANYAGSVKVNKFGTRPIKIENLYNYFTDKVLDKNILNDFGNILRKDNKKIVFTNGCFDILHSGHLHVLKEAKKLGDILIVGLNSDESIKRLKGNERPIFKLKERIEFLTSLEFVDYVVVFEEETPLKIIKLLYPDVLVKGSDYKNHYVVGTREVEENGGKVILIDLINGKSTTNIINKIKGDKNE